LAHRKGVERARTQLSGVEYGMMAVYAEGLNILRHADAGLHQRDVSAGVTPLRDPGPYQYPLDIPAVAEVWRRGSVIASWLVNLTAEGFLRSGNLSDFEGRVSDSGEGRWTSIAAIDVSAPAPVLTTALHERIHVAGRGRLRRPGPVGDAVRLRWPRGRQGLIRP
jgi:6-phosphogluconate dehydrogenase